ncbi:hypothetical protein FN846DRAFT_893676 [Sphaerosporella brunnea]|uniref:Uncharacterized protein n=1 Tax=Sphaerosporella brunnea TaxID=1250544 RepID=A0A5J5EL67_9PEZI|nr:hypothetical protein FN846DRAFT_893676 [Sphaerosporella brunnea]
MRCWTFTRAAGIVSDQFSLTAFEERESDLNSALDTPMAQSQCWEHDTVDGGSEVKLIPNRIYNRTVMCLARNHLHINNDPDRLRVRSHRSLYEKAQLLHRDIDTKNFLLPTHPHSGASKSRNQHYSTEAYRHLRIPDHRHGFVPYVHGRPAVLLVRLCHQQKRRCKVFATWGGLQPVTAAKLGDVMWPGRQDCARTQVQADVVRCAVYASLIRALDLGFKAAQEETEVVIADATEGVEAYASGYQLLTLTAIMPPLLCARKTMKRA